LGCLQSRPWMHLADAPKFGKVFVGIVFLTQWKACITRVAGFCVICDDISLTIVT
jgi:hypothetical protein